MLQQENGQMHESNNAEDIRRQILRVNYMHVLFTSLKMTMMRFTLIA